MRDMRWLTDTEDPRTVLTACLGILVLNALLAKPMVDQGAPALWIVSVLGVAVAQFVWALIRSQRWRANRTPQGAPSKPDATRPT